MAFKLSERCNFGQLAKKTVQNCGHCAPVRPIYAWCGGHGRHGRWRLWGAGMQGLRKCVRKTSKSTTSFHCTITLNSHCTVWVTLSCKSVFYEFGTRHYEYHFQTSGVVFLCNSGILYLKLSYYVQICGLGRPKAENTKNGL